MEGPQGRELTAMDSGADEGELIDPRSDRSDPSLCEDTKGRDVPPRESIVVCHPRLRIIPGMA